MRRRDLAPLFAVGTTLALGVSARDASAQKPATRVVGTLASQEPGSVETYRRIFGLGLQETGYVDGNNVTVEHRWANNHPDQLQDMAAGFVRRQVSVIATLGGPATEAAAAATATIPVVFAVAEDPIKLGLVSSLARPNGNRTGVNFFAVELAAKRLETLRELIPAMRRVAVLINPGERTIAANNLRDIAAAAEVMGIELAVHEASTSEGIDHAFTAMLAARPDALFISSGPFFTNRRIQLAHLATRHALPAIHASRLYAEVGGLISYGASVAEAWRQVGVYVGRILRGDSPTELPVIQSTKIELIVNAQTARILGVTIPPSLLTRADEVIE